MGAIGTVAVLGAGAWGRALAYQFALSGPVRLWSHNPNRLAPFEISADQPPITISYHQQLADAVRECQALVLAVPSGGIGDLLVQLKALETDATGVPIVIAAKGFAEDPVDLLSNLIAAELPGCPVSILSGPSFAADLLAGLPTAITLALKADGDAPEALATALVQRLASPLFRVYLSDDVIGVQVGGAAKNVIAIACGIAAGLEYGSNTHAALISRGLAEISRLATALGGQSATMMGLSGVGDLVLTCSNTKSRNYSYGLRRGQGMSHEEAVAASAGVIEGIDNAANVLALARQHGVEMPITEAIDALLHQDFSLEQIIKGLMARPYKGEGGVWADLSLPS